MPSKSKAQRKLMAIAEHAPEKLYKRNRGVLKMSKKQLSEYAKTKEKVYQRRKRDHITKKAKDRETIL